MKIAHVGDVHWGIGYPGPSPDSRFNDICNTMDQVADRIISEGCNLVLFSGDAFKDAKVFLDRANLEIQAFTRWIRKITGAGIEIIAISGTPSHDAVAGYELIRQMQIPGLTIVTQPDIIRFEGPVSMDVACIPGLNRTTIANRDAYKGLSASEIHQLMTDHLTSLVRAQYTQCSLSPCVMMTHMTCAGADTGFADLLLQQEAVLTREAIDSTNFDLVCLGHIHRPQRIEGLNTPAFYSGSPERLSFNDEKVQAGFWIHEIEADGYIGSEFIETSARQFITITLDPGQDVLVGIQDAMVRVRISCDEEQAKLISHQAIIKQCYDRKAFYVSEVKLNIEKSSRVRAAAANAEMGPLDALRLWCQVTETADVDALATRAESLLQEVSA